MNQLRHLVVALATAGAVVLTGTAARASAPPDVPDEYLTASETEIPGEAEFWTGAIPCPELDGLVADETSTAYTPGDRVTRTCSYYEGDTSTFANFRGNLSVDWIKPGRDSSLFCGYNSGDLGWEVVFGDPNLDAQATASFDEWPDLAERFAPYAEAWFEQWARPFAAPCSLIDVPDCPEVDGWVRDGFFGPQDRMEITPPPGSESAVTATAITHSCGYTAPSASYDEQIRMSIGTTALVPNDRNTPDEVQVACSTGDRFSYGVGIRGTGGTYAISTTYSTNSADPFDLSPFMAAIDDIVDTAAAIAIPCDGVELLPSDPFTPLPPWLEEVFTSEATTTGLVPLVSELEAGTAVTETAPATTDPAAPPTTASPTTDDDEGRTATTVAAGPGDAPPPAATAGSGRSTLGLLMKIVAVGSIVISVLGLVFTFWFVGRETRVRPKWDVARIAISVVVAAVMVLVFAAGAPVWAIAVAVVVGLGLGLWQGRNLVVTMTDRGVFAKRNAWAVAAFLVGIIITQVAGLLNRTNVFRAGIALTIFSAALAIGLYFGRRPKIEAVRAAAAVFVAFVVLGPLFALTPSGGTSASTPEPDDEPLSPRPELTAQLTEMADWTSATISSGLWSNNGKPLLELSLPIGFDAVPDPVTWNVAWDDAWNEGYRYDLTETYTFSMRADGICCSIDYQAVGDRFRGDQIDPVDFDARLADIQLLATEGPGYLGDDLGWLPGLPFAERLEHRLGAEPEAVDCHRPVAETRDYDSLQEAGGDVEIRKGLGDLVQPGLQTVVGVPCEIPEFTLEAALELAPEPPPPDDPIRVRGRLGNCPVTSELIAALNSGSTLPGVHTETAGMVMFDGNANACEFGALFGGPAIGQGGRGETRHEFAMDLAQPREGEWDRGVDAWFPDECCIAPASVTQPPSDDICAVDEQGIPVAPPDLADGGSCFHASRHQLPQGEIYIETDYSLADGPDTFIRAAMPWGSFMYRCHHCEVGDPQIEGMLDTIIQTGRGMAADVTYVVATPDMVVAEDTVQVGTVPATTPDGPPATTEGDASDDTTSRPDEITVAEAEDLADLVLDDDATDAEREAAVAVIIGLIGAGAVGATTLGEAGVGARDVIDAWRTGGRRGVDELIEDRNRPEPEPPDEPEPPPDPDEIVSAWDPTVDNGPDEPPGGWVRVTRAERDRLEGLDRDQRSAATQERLARERAERQAEIDTHQERMDAIAQEAKDDLRREQLERERLINEAEQDFWNDPVNQVVSIFIDAGTHIGQDLADTPRVAGQIIHDTIAAVHEELTDPENWQVLGETLYGTLGDAVRLGAGDEEAWDHFVEGSDAIGRGADMIATAIANDPVGFAEAVLAIDRLRDSMDPDAPLEERLSDYGAFATEVLISWATAGGGRAADATADGIRVLDATSDARTAGRVLDGAQEAGAAARAAENLEDLTDAQRAATRMAGAPPHISDDVFRARQQAWAELQQTASRNVDEFEDAIDQLDAVRRGGNPQEIAAAEQRARDAMVRVQADKRTLQEINLRSEGTRSAFNDMIGREIYEPIDREVLNTFSRRNGIGPLTTEPTEVLADGTRVFRDPHGNAIHIAEPTNPSGTIKVGADRDFTVRIERSGQVRDVHHDEVATVYNQALRDQIGDPARLGLPDDPAALANRLDQAMTSQFHVESYTDLDTILRDPSGALRDPQQIRLAMENKGVHWMNQFDDVPDARLAEDVMAEGMRQLSKQFGNQVQGRFNAMNTLRAEAGLPPLRMPERLQEAQRILSQVNPKPPGRPTLSPVEAERLLHQMGTSPSNFADEMGSFMQMVEQSRVQLP